MESDTTIVCFERAIQTTLSYRDRVSSPCAITVWNCNSNGSSIKLCRFIGYFTLQRFSLNARRFSSAFMSILQARIKSPPEIWRVWDRFGDMMKRTNCIWSSRWFPRDCWHDSHHHATPPNDVEQIEGEILEIRVAFLQTLIQQLYELKGLRVLWQHS